MGVVGDVKAFADLTDGETLPTLLEGESLGVNTTTVSSPIYGAFGFPLGTQSSRSSTLCLCLSPLSWLLSNQPIKQSIKQVTFKHWVDECNQQSVFSKLRLSTAVVLPYRKVNPK